MAPLAELDYGICACGGRFENHWVEIRMAVCGQPIVLPGIPQGVCRNCGAHIFKSHILVRIESVKSRKAVTELS